MIRIINQGVTPNNIKNDLVIFECSNCTCKFDTDEYNSWYNKENKLELTISCPNCKSKCKIINEE
jgi:Zn finger protein HypA/HybF involved in hydrogenase expression